MRDNSVFLGLCTSHVSRPGWIKKTKLEYQKKWYIPNYFSNSVLDPNISKIDGNGPFCPTIRY